MNNNKTLIQFFEWYTPSDGQHWNRFREAVPRLLDLGITGAWLPPAYKGTRGATSEGYDVYDIFDLGEFDQKGTVRTKYGSRQEYTDAIKYARNAGLEVLIDVVLNHMGGAEETETIKVRKVDPDDRTVFTSDEMEIVAYTKFKFPGRKGKHSDFKWNYECFTGVDYAVDKKESAIFSIINKYGEDWEPMVDDEKGNFDFLMLNDIETRNPAVRNELKHWIRWYYETVPFDGVRLDAVKHINPAFFIEWLDYIKTEINPDIQIIGEFWLSDDLSVLLKYLEAIDNRMSLFDAPLHHNFSIASNEGDEYDLRKILQDSLISVHPDLSVTFVDNHDTQPLQSLEEYTEWWFRPLGYALILLREAGTPCVFYPDLYGTKYSGKNKKGKQVEVELPVMDVLPALLQLRRDYAYGKQTDYFKHKNCIGWTRDGDSNHPDSGLVVIMSNKQKGQHALKMLVGRQHAGSIYYNFLDKEAPEVLIDKEGMGEFHIHGATVAVYIGKKQSV